MRYATITTLRTYTEKQLKKRAEKLVREHRKKSKLFEQGKSKPVNTQFAKTPFTELNWIEKEHKKTLKIYMEKKRENQQKKRRKR